MYVDESAFTYEISYWYLAQDQKTPWVKSGDSSLGFWVLVIWGGGRGWWWYVRTSVRSCGKKPFSVINANIDRLILGVGGGVVSGLIRWYGDMLFLVINANNDQLHLCVLKPILQWWWASVISISYIRCKAYNFFLNPSFFIQMTVSKN